MAFSKPACGLNDRMLVAMKQTASAVLNAMGMYCNGPASSRALNRLPANASNPASRTSTAINCAIRKRRSVPPRITCKATPSNTRQAAVLGAILLG